MKKITLLLALSIATLSQTFAQSTADIFSKYFEASGGKTLWDGVKTYNVKQTYFGNAVTDFDLNVSANLQNNSIQKTRTILKRGFIYGLTPTDAFLKIPMGSLDKAPVYTTKDMDDKDKSQLKREMIDLLSAPLNFNNKSFIATFVGAEADGNHVQLSNNDAVYDFWFSTTTNLPTRERIKIKSTGEEINKTYTAYTTSPYGLKYPSDGTYVSSVDKKNVRLTTTIVFNDALTGITFKR